LKNEKTLKRPCNIALQYFLYNYFVSFAVGFAEVNLMINRGQRFEFWSSPSLYASLSLLLMCAFYWDIVDLLTPFIFPWLEMGVVLVFVCVSIGALVRAFRARGIEPFQRFKFVVLNAVVALTAMFFPFTEMRSKYDFDVNLSKRMEVIEMVKAGKLSRPYSHNHGICVLPGHLRHLSKSGEIYVSNGQFDSDIVNPRNLHVFFYTFRGILSHFSGFEYVADGTAPEEAADAREIKILSKNWYWICH